MVSFLIVAYNAGGFLRESLASAFGQTYPNIEVVLVDNASTDGSVDTAVREFGDAGMLRVVRSATNLGPSGGAVLGLPHCRGAYIARLDADDVALPDRVAEQVRYLERHPRKDAVGADALRINASGRAWALALSLRSEFLRRHASKWDIGCLHTTLFVRRTATEERFYNPTLFTGGDFEWIEWLARSGRLGLVPRVLCLYRQHGFSITRRLRNLQRLTGCELKYLISAAGADPTRRDELGAADFGRLLHDRRLSVPEKIYARKYEADCIKKGNRLAAAYFASISNHWPLVPWLLVRAAASGLPWRDVAAVALCRTGWPVWRRMQSAFFNMARSLPSSRPIGENEIGKSMRLAARLDAFRDLMRRRPAP